MCSSDLPSRPHIVAIAAYAAVKGQNLLRPMIVGTKRLPAGTPTPRIVSPVRAAILLAVSVAAAATLVNLI